jgi:hypothetical protein
MWQLSLDLYDKLGTDDMPFAGIMIALSNYDRTKCEGFWEASNTPALKMFAQARAGFFRVSGGNTPPNLTHFFDADDTKPAFVLFNAPHSLHSHYSQYPHGCSDDRGDGEVRNPANPVGTRSKLRWLCLGPVIPVGT